MSEAPERIWIDPLDYAVTISERRRVSGQAGQDQDVEYVRADRVHLLKEALGWHGIDVEWTDDGGMKIDSEAAAAANLTERIERLEQLLHSISFVGNVDEKAGLRFGGQLVVMLPGDSLTKVLPRGVTIETLLPPLGGAS